jgi:anti-sigma-K factor RskA
MVLAMASELHVIDLLPAYALGCLDEDDLVRVSEHLAGCAECRVEWHAYQAVADELALAAPDVAPPDDLKARLMQRTDPEGPPAASPRAAWWDRLTRLMQRASPVWGLAGLLVILALAIGNLWLWQQLSRYQAATQPGPLPTIPLAGTDTAPDASGLMVVSADGAHGTLVVDGLPPLDAEHQYQLWLVHDDYRVSGGVFSVDAQGYGSLWIVAPRPLSNYSSFGITIEPTGGSPGPTGQKVLGSAT